MKFERPKIELEKDFFMTSPVQRLIETYHVAPEDFALLGELLKFHRDLVTVTLHHLFPEYRERSEQELKRFIKNLERPTERDEENKKMNEKQKKLCELALTFYRKYGWEASYMMERILESFGYD